jgi:hypothetical protein
LNTGVVVHGTTAILTHSEENLDSNEMGMIVAVDANAKGEIKKAQAKWRVYGWQGGYSSPVIDGDRLYQVDNGANIAAFDVNNGKQLWLQNLGTIQKASPVLADGKLYVGTENGKFFILQPSATGVKILDEDQLGTEQLPEAIIASVAVSDGRVYLVSDSGLYAIGRKTHARATATESVTPAAAGSVPTHVQVVPTELMLQPGATVKFRVRMFDSRGLLIREQPVTDASWTVENLKGSVAGGELTIAPDSLAQAGLVKATVGGISGTASVRVFPSLPWSENFDAIAPNTLPPTWVNTTLKFTVREVNGNKVLVKTTEGSSLLSRARAYMGPSGLSNYTVEADVNATQKRRQLGDAGVIAQRYVLALYGNSQMLHLEPWQPETARTVKIPFAWKADNWYRLKLQVENLPDGKVRARGKVWLASETEPAAWMIERIDPIPNLQGAPGIFGNALAEIYFDNLWVYSNKWAEGSRQ